MSTPKKVNSLAKARRTSSPVEVLQKTENAALMDNVMLATMSDKERFVHLEDVIADNLQAFFKVGMALKEIRDKHYYVMKGFKNFNEYCVSCFDITRSYADKLICANNVVEDLKDVFPPSELPARESQTRRLVQLPPSERVEVWGKVVEASKQKNKKITSAMVDEVFVESYPKRDNTTGKKKSHKVTLREGTYEKLQRLQQDSPSKTIDEIILELIGDDN